MFRSLSLTRATTPIPSLYRTVTNSITSFRPSLAPLFYTFSSTSSSLGKNGEGSSDDEDEDAGAFILGRDTEGPPKLFVVQPRLRPESVLQAKLSEALNLARSLEDKRDWSGGEECGEKRTLPHLVVQNPMIRSKGRADKFFGPGTVENVKCHLHAIDSDGELDGIFVNATLSGIQQRNLETAWGKPVLDRVALIIEIFNAHAQTKEAKLQSELAALMYRSTRLVRACGPSGRLTFGMSGEAEVVSAKGKGSGGRGFLSGAGESELQLQRRRIQERREKLLHEIEEVRRTRALQRYGRKRRGGSFGQGLSTVAVVGYTNAGKSTLVSALSRSDLYSDDRLFATVDPRLRSVILPSGRKALLSDTVGFISDLPVQLVEAFHATLEEVVDADLLLHVLDSSAENLEEQRSTVLQVLQQIGVSEEKIKNMIEVWNKVDLLDKEHGISVIPDSDKNDEKITNSDLNLNEQLLQQPSKEQAVGNVPTDTTDIDMDDFMGKGQNKKAVGNCGLGEAAHANACLELVDDVELSLSPSDPAVDIDGEDQKEISDGTDDDAELMPMGESSYDNLSPRSLLHKRLTADSLLVYQPKCIQRVETSAIMGVGLQQLLHLIDSKLGNGKSLEKESRSEIFDRKWRPSKASVQ